MPSGFANKDSYSDDEKNLIQRIVDKMAYKGAVQISGGPSDAFKTVVQEYCEQKDIPCQVVSKRPSVFSRTQDTYKAPEQEDTEEFNPEGGNDRPGKT